MGRSRAQRVTVTLGGPQTVNVGPATNRSRAQRVSVSYSTNVQVVNVKPARKIPTE